MPDRAVVRVAVEAEGSSPNDAYSRAARISAAVDAVLTAHSGAISRTTTTSLIVNPRSRRKKGESVRAGWRAVRTSAVAVDDFGHLGVRLATLVEAGAAVEEVRWELARSNSAYRDAQRRAAEQAREKAEIWRRPWESRSEMSPG